MLIPIVLCLNPHSRLLNVSVFVVQVTVTHLEKKENSRGVKLGENRRGDFIEDALKRIGKDICSGVSR